jgi:hypothetical protein
MRRAFLLVAAVACGGSKGQLPDPQHPLGETHETAAATQPAATQPVEPPADDPAVSPAAAGTSIVLQNEGDTELNFGVTKGWAPVIFGYTGKPPKAKAVIFFESACTASCDAAPDEVCPVCPEPQTKREELAMARTETVPPGGSLTVPWDGMTLAYEKAPGKKRCKCWRKAEPAPDTYTIKGCGLRAATEPGKPSRPVCAEAQVTIAAGEPPPRTITLTFTR